MFILSEPITYKKWHFLTSPISSTTFYNATATSANNGYITVATDFPGIPSSAEAVIMRFQGQSTTPGNYVCVGPGTTSAQKYQGILRIGVASVLHNYTSLVTIKSDGTIYLTVSGTVTGLELDCIAYYL